MTIADGNGAALLAPPNLNRPRSSRTSDARMTYRCHHFVSVRAGRRQQTVAPLLADSYALCTQRPMCRPYGGFIQHTPVQS